LAEERRQLDADKQATAREKENLADWRQGAEQQLQTALKAAEQSNLRGAALESRIKRIAGEYNLDADELLQDILENRAADRGRTQEERQEAQVDLSKYATAEQVNNQISAMGLLPLQVRDLEHEYRRLFGKEYDGSIEELATTGFKEIIDRQKRGENIDFKGYVREKLDFAGQRQRNDEKEREDWKENTRKEIEMDVRSKLSAEDPGRFQRREVEQSPFLKKKEREQAPATRGPAQDHQRRQNIYAAFDAEQRKHSA
jgi:hypothetical protein